MISAQKSVKKPSDRLPQTDQVVSEHAMRRTPVNPLLELQGAIGNQAVLQLLRSEAIQTKLAINQSGGGYEQEAVQAADTATRIAVSDTPPSAAVSMQAKNKQNAPAASSASAMGGGRPLSEPVRSQFERLFGWDFSGVRLHTGSSAAQAAASAGAKAFTRGSDIVFGSRVENPESSQHRPVLAHELAHVVQQEKSTSTPTVGMRGIAGSLSAAPQGRLQALPTVTGIVLPAPAELGVGRIIMATAVVAPGTPFATALTWRPVGAPAGVNVTPIGPLGALVSATPAAAAGRRFRVQCALTATPGDKAESAFITVVGITNIRFTPAPAFVPIAALIPASGPANTADPNRNGIAGNTANVIVRTNPGGSPTTRPIAVTLPTPLGAAVAGTVITPGATTGDMIVQVTDNATGTSQRTTLIVNPVPTAVAAFTGQRPGPANMYGCINTFGWTWSDATVRGRNRIIGEAVTAATPPRDDLGLGPANGAWNPAPVLRLAVPANNWNDNVLMGVGATAGAAGDLNMVNLNRYVGPGVANPLPRVSNNNQGFHYSSWTGAWSNRFDLGIQRQSLVQAGANFVVRTEQPFPGGVAPVFDQAYKGPPLITLSNVRVTPLTPAARALAADNTATASIRVTTNVPGRQVNWSVVVGGAAVTFLIPAGPAIAVAVGSTARLRTGNAVGHFTIRAADTVFPNRQGDGAVDVVAVALNIVTPGVQAIAAGVRTVTIDLMAQPGGRTINWTVDAAAFAAGVRVSRSSPSGSAAPDRRATVTRPAAFIGPVVVTATDSILPARTVNFTINFL